MAVKMSTSMATDIYEEIIEAARPEGVSRSEWMERLVRRGWEAEKARQAGITIQAVKEKAPVGKVAADIKADFKVKDNSGRKKHAPDGICTGSETEWQSEPSNVERLIWGMNPVFEKRDASLALIEVEQ